MQPRIGLTTDFRVFHGEERMNILPFYAEAVAAAGGTPLLLPSLGPEEGHWDRLLDSCDGLLATGGSDVDPALWGAAMHSRTKTAHPRRQKADLGLIERAYRRRMPVLGICLGCQEMAVSRGGRLFQHVSDEFGSQIGHKKPRAMRTLHHSVDIERGSLLARVVGDAPLRVNTSHHQAVREPGRRMRIVARSPDGVTEAIETTEPGRFFLGVQWHPEYLCEHRRHIALFEAHCEAAAQWRRKKS